MSQQCSWQTRSRPLEGLCLYYALLGLSQAPGFAGGHDFLGPLQRRGRTFYALYGSLYKTKFSVLPGAVADNV